MTRRPFAALLALGGGIGLHAAVACGGGAGGAPVALRVEPARPGAPPMITGDAAPSEAAPALEVVLGPGRICAVADGRVYCTRIDPEQPIVDEKNAIAGIEDATSVAVGQGFVCASTRQGKALCAGDNSFGQLGAKIAAERSEAAVEVAGLDRVTRVFAGPWHACATREDASLHCWGRNESGQTGSDTVYRPEARELAAPSVVPGVVAEAAAAAFSATCAHGRGETRCWGRTRDDGARTNERPHAVTALAGVGGISAGESAFCGIAEGRVRCWADGRRLVSGVGSGSGPVTIGTITNAKRIAVADDHACALLGDGRVSCFGYPYSQALGRPTEESGFEALAPAIVEGLPRATAISVTSGLSCALTRDAELFCWGRWYGAEGSRNEPKPTRFRLR